MVLSQRFTDFISQHSLCTKTEPLVLAVSGGKDSVVMAHLFAEVGFTFSIAHVNFNLRGDESTRDETFVHLLAENLGVPFMVERFDTQSFANTHKISTQMAARTLRYQWFEKLVAEKGYKQVAVAHHLSDIVETTLINLVRGTGISGLHGIKPVNGHIIRPLLFLTSAEISAFVDAQSIQFVEDSSNAHLDYVRNKLRLQVIPQLREINPSLEKTFAENAKIFSETEQLVNLAIEDFETKSLTETRDAVSISIEAVRTAAPKKILLYGVLRKFNFSSEVTDQLLGSLNAQSGTSFFSDSHRATVNRDEILITPLNEFTAEKIWPEESDEINLFGGKLLKSSADAENVAFQPGLAYVPKEKLIFPLKVRSWHPGDVFMPFGMRQFKKLSDFYIDEKIALPTKSQIPVLVNGNGEIIWLAGLRQDQRYKIEKATKKVVIFEWKK